ncbi:phage antirepressor N-terminal domain-containing protein [Moraxella bovoculi]|uniref:phage antirepressor N-terminal domain-containing protein n=1 Tax=Moraxella bovoculi TaxID=386891 RepID=UPI003F4FDD33
MTNQIQTVNFHNQSLLTLQKDGIAYVAMKPICENIGLDWKSQFARIKRDEVLAQGMVIITTPTKGGLQEMLCLPIHYLNGWLFGVDTNRVKAEIRETLITYKKECYQALFDYWNNGVAVNHRLSSDDTLPLRNAVSMATGVLRLDYSTIYKMVHQRFGIDEIKELSKEQILQAVEYVHELMAKSKGGMNDRLSISAQHLAWHTQFIYSWYKAIEEPFRALSPRLSGQIHDHIIHAANSANTIGKHLGYDGMNPDMITHQHWDVGRYY